MATGDALIRLYERTERWDALATLLEEEAAAGGAPARSGPILCKLGDLHAGRTGHLADAIASYGLACEQGSAEAPAGLEALIARLDPDAPDQRGAFVLSLIHI